jgi:hypothetical protein
MVFTTSRIGLALLLTEIVMCPVSCADSEICVATRAVPLTPPTETHIETSRVTFAPKPQTISLP